MVTTDSTATCETCGRSFIHGDCVICDRPLAGLGSVTPGIRPIAQGLHRSASPAPSSARG